MFHCITDSLYCIGQSTVLLKLGACYKNKGGHAEPTNLSLISHQLLIWCAVGDKVVGSTHLCFYSAWSLYNKHNFVPLVLHSFIHFILMHALVVWIHAGHICVHLALYIFPCIPYVSSHVILYKECVTLQFSLGPHVYE